MPGRFVVRVSFQGLAKGALGVFPSAQAQIPLADQDVQPRDRGIGMLGELQMVQRRRRPALGQIDRAQGDMRQCSMSAARERRFDYATRILVPALCKVRLEKRLNEGDVGRIPADQ